MPLSPGELPRICRIFYQPPPKKILIIPFIFQGSQDKGNQQLKKTHAVLNPRLLLGWNWILLGKVTWSGQNPRLGEAGGRTWLWARELLQPGVSVP